MKRRKKKSDSSIPEELDIYVRFLNKKIKTENGNEKRKSIHGIRTVKCRFFLGMTVTYPDDGV